MGFSEKIERRDFLKMGAAAAAGAILPGGIVKADDAPGSAASAGAEMQKVFDDLMAGKPLDITNAKALMQGVIHTIQSQTGKPPMPGMAEFIEAADGAKKVGVFFDPQQQTIATFTNVSNGDYGSILLTDKNRGEAYQLGKGLLTGKPEATAVFEDAEQMVAATNYRKKIAARTLEWEMENPDKAKPDQSNGRTFDGGIRL